MRNEDAACTHHAEVLLLQVEVSDCLVVCKDLA